MSARPRLREVLGRDPGKDEQEQAVRDRRDEAWAAREAAALGPLELVSVQFDRWRTETARPARLARNALRRARSARGQAQAHTRLARATAEVDAACERLGRAIETETQAAIDRKGR
jgi:hypothetical protein